MTSQVTTGYRAFSPYSLRVVLQTLQFYPHNVTKNRLFRRFFAIKSNFKILE